MNERAQIVVELESDLKDAFVEVARSEDRPASEIARDLIANYVAESVERDNVDPEYWAFIEKRVEAGRKSIREGKGIPNSEIETHFAALRADIMKHDG